MQVCHAYNSSTQSWCFPDRGSTLGMRRPWSTQPGCQHTFMRMMIGKLCGKACGVPQGQHLPDSSLEAGTMGSQHPAISGRYGEVWRERLRVSSEERILRGLV